MRRKDNLVFKNLKHILELDLYLVYMFSLFNTHLIYTLQIKCLFINILMEIMN